MAVIVGERRHREINGAIRSPDPEKLENSSKKNLTDRFSTLMFFLTSRNKQAHTQSSFSLDSPRVREMKFSFAGSKRHAVFLGMKEKHLMCKTSFLDASLSDVIELTRN